MGTCRVRYVCALALCALAACSTSESAQRVDDTALGDDTFASICAKCHGEHGHGGLPMTPDGTKPRDLSDPAWQASRTDAQIEEVVRDGKLPMPAFKGVLTTEQIRAVVGKVRRLRKEARK